MSLYILILIFFFNAVFCETNPDRILAIEAEVPPEEKGPGYYLVTTLFVVSIIASTLLTGSFLVLLLLLWKHFKSLKYFWFLMQLTLSVFILSTLNLVINVPATLFSLITKDFVASDVYTTLSYTIDYFHYAILISNMVIAIQRFCVFFFRQLTAKIFDSFIIYEWLCLVWILPAIILLILVFNNCKYNFKKAPSNFVLNCQPWGSIVDLPPPRWIQILELVVQFGIPFFILFLYIAVIFKIFAMKKSTLNKNEIRVLVQAIVIFVFFQASSSVFLICQTIAFNTATAFVIKRIINTLEIFAGAATPCFSFFTSKEIRKLLSSKIAAVSSQGSSNLVVRKPTLAEVNS
ncbi:G-protein coupled receptors family 1 profile domain-containing protein [Caenorhabditis elegans]|uniref:G-protein coupled receptors family 1 profile domain-containing protein n=1 Tax=Caenorhabditis elegans TaxID=6239 RepID=Q22362_CAEEL|nr:G-protein coupled receptors family 1 profile domain-containing protein [Caenorhabditis elegans]CAB01517.3 G-protein coupled receptors family 1 profile domain-containing protein [Caenorhabditis elegans]|eukprot:NP_506279.2 Uncharacterized protein CELE_T09E8.4 [Caenorhabditis elegans]